MKLFQRKNLKGANKMKSKQNKTNIPKNKKRKFNTALHNLRQFEKKYKDFIPKKYKVIDSNIEGWDSFDPSCNSF